MSASSAPTEVVCSGRSGSAYSSLVSDQESTTEGFAGSDTSGICSKGDDLELITAAANCKI